MWVRWALMIKRCEIMVNGYFYAPQEPRGNPWGCLAAVLVGLAFCAVVGLLTGCTTTRYVPVESVRTEYRDRARAVHDTVLDTVLRHSFVIRQDSMAVRMNGDTVYVDRWHTVMRVLVDKGRTLRSNAVHDTVTACRTDSVGVPYPVERTLTRWEKAKMDFGGVAMAAAAILLIVGIVNVKR